MHERLRWVVLALGMTAAAGVAWAQQHPGSGQPPHCVGGSRVVAPTTLRVPPALATCTADADCKLAENGCCPSCPTNPEAFRAIRVDRASAWYHRACPHSTDCPGNCNTPVPATIHASCVASRCEVTVVDAACGAASPFGPGDS